MSASQLPLPLYKKIFLKYTSHRVFDVVILVLLISLLLYRLLSLNDHGFYWLLAFLCESWFTFYWFLLVNSKWNPVQYITYPENLDERFSELPPVDMFVTTADAVLEPPIITVNTVLSLLAVDYPANKLTCYVSDDGCSSLTFYSLLQASRFAKLWVPFCKKYKIQVRAPFRYFLVKPTFSNDNAEFQQEWIKMKEEYEQFRERIENAAKMSAPLDETGELAVFAEVERGNHPTIVKIIWENKEALSDGVPHLIYISREKRPKHQHHYKAGAMNVLTRVSGLMTNAPFMLNVDCDMFVNNPEVVRQAMCVLLDTNNESESAFVQFPQTFYDAPKDDPFGNQFVVFFQYIVPGITGIQGLFYCGTGCFHRRKVIYGLWPDDEDTSIVGKLSDNNGLVKEYGNSKEFLESAARALKSKIKFSTNLSNNLEAACQVADCAYERGTDWGNKLGWMYGSIAEDLLTGLTIHNKGWKTICLAPAPPAFLGCAPSVGPVAMTQQKRWSTGLLEILVGRNSPIFGFLTAKLQLRQCLAYVCVLSWSIESIPELCYAALPAYCIIANSHFLPKVHEPAVCIPVAIFVLYNLYTLLEYLKTGLSFRAWWNNQRMGRIAEMNAYLFGVLGALLKFLGLSETVFEVTPKGQLTDDDVSGANTEFTFDEMPLFVTGTALLLAHITAMFTILSGLRRPVSCENGVGILEVLGSMWVILCFWPFLKGLFRKGKYGIPLPTIFKSAALAFVFVNLCWMG